MILLIYIIREKAMNRNVLKQLFLFCFISYPLLFSLNKQEQLYLKTKEKEFEIPPTEDLMREHGLLNRVLLIYEEIIKQIDSGKFPINELAQSVEITKKFIEEYHEKLEENYLFPLFEKAKKELRLVKTLRNQHEKGRQITNRLQQIVKLKEINQKIKKEIKLLLQQFIKMYRPHEAREDTVLFPQVRSFLSEEQFKELGEKFEELEHMLFGPKGFEKIVDKVATIEKALGIYQLEQFTPISE